MYQNRKSEVSGGDEFMDARRWKARMVDPQIARRGSRAVQEARTFTAKIAEGTRICGDPPGLQFDSTTITNGTCREPIGGIPQSLLGISLPRQHGVQSPLEQ